MERDVNADFINRHYARLLRHVRRRIALSERARDIPLGELEAEDILDAVVERVLAEPDSKPGNVNHYVWLFVLCDRKLKEFAREYRSKHDGHIPLGETLDHAGKSRDSGEFDPENPLSFIGAEFDSEDINLESLIPDLRSKNPEEEVEIKDLLAWLESESHGWPYDEQIIFELHAVEGLSPEEIALVLNISMDESKNRVNSFQERVQESFRDRDVKS